MYDREITGTAMSFFLPVAYDPHDLWEKEAIESEAKVAIIIFLLSLMSHSTQRLLQALVYAQVKIDIWWIDGYMQANFNYFAKMKLFFIILMVWESTETLHIYIFYII